VPSLIHHPTASTLTLFCFVLLSTPNIFFEIPLFTQTKKRGAKPSTTTSQKEFRTSSSDHHFQDETTHHRLVSIATLAGGIASAIGWC
jgi:hypothetical protein